MTLRSATPTLRSSQKVALVATAAGLLSACGFTPTRSSPPPSSLPPPIYRPVRNVELSNCWLVFTTAVGTTSAAQTLIVSNPTNHPILLGNISLGGGGKASFAQRNDCGAELPAGRYCVFHITYQAPSPDDTNAELNFEVRGGQGKPADGVSVVLYGRAL